MNLAEIDFLREKHIFLLLSVEDLVAEMVYTYFRYAWTSLIDLHHLWGSMFLHRCPPQSAEPRPKTKASPMSGG